MKYDFLKDEQNLESIRQMLECRIHFKKIAEHFDVPLEKQTSFYLSVRKAMKAKGMWKGRE